jgi:acyl carrier protein
MSQDKTTEERVIEIVARVFHKEVAEIKRDTRFVDDLYAKSINIVELFAVLEYELEIPAIPISKARQMNTVGKAIDLVLSLIDKGAMKSA